MIHDNEVYKHCITNSKKNHLYAQLRSSHLNYKGLLSHSGSKINGLVFKSLSITNFNDIGMKKTFFSTYSHFGWIRRARFTSDARLQLTKPGLGLDLNEQGTVRHQTTVSLLKS